MEIVVEPPGTCPKCRRNPLLLETSGVWGDRLYCLCGYSSDLPAGWRRPSGLHVIDEEAVAEAA